MTLRGLTVQPVADSVPFDNSTNGFVANRTQPAIEEARNSALGKPRFTLTLINNSATSDGQHFSYTELVPNTPVILPINCVLKEITFSNSRPDADAQLNIYKRPTPGSSSGETLLQTWSFTASLTKVLSGLSYSFSAGQEIYITYTTIGRNPLDVALILFFNVV